uniref:Uncharacterized protein n=1 Tax=Rheinheimera sp. BAL341 TaxID=1708203 RepID=A0A486XRI9_9GAMM
MAHNKALLSPLSWLGRLTLRSSRPKALRYVSVDMNKICVILSIVALAACEAHLDNKVGYGKTLDIPADKVCFNAVFEELKAQTAYTLSVTTVEENGKIMNYELMIDGQAVNEDLDVFTPASFQLTKEFMSNVQQRCAG